MDDLTPQRRLLRKRKADVPPENNERLSKRLSLLNLEQSGPKLYVPVESPQAQSTITPYSNSAASYTSSPTTTSNSLSKARWAAARAAAQQDDDDDDDDSMMQLDDSKYKVYIRNLDEELSSEDEPEEGKLIFLPDIEKHLRSTRIPASVLASPDSDMLSKQLVLYSVPSSITVPEEHDSVRKAIIEARARAREKQKAEAEAARFARQLPAAMPSGFAMDVNMNGPTNGYMQSAPVFGPPVSQMDDDPDAMELD